MATIFHLMDFDRVQRYNLVVSVGPYTGTSWELQDELGQKVEGMVSYEITSDAVSEEHKVVLKTEDDQSLTLALVGISQCQTISKEDLKNSSGSDSKP